MRVYARGACVCCVLPSFVNVSCDVDCGWGSCLLSVAVWVERRAGTNLRVESVVRLLRFGLVVVLNCSCGGGGGGDGDDELH